MKRNIIPIAFMLVIVGTLALCIFCPGFNWSAAGKGIVELKDGSIQEFDLDNVKTVLLH